MEEVELLRPNSLDYFLPIQLVHSQVILDGHEVCPDVVLQLVCCRPGWESKRHLVGNVVLVLQRNELVVPSKHPTDGLRDFVVHDPDIQLFIWGIMDDWAFPPTHALLHLVPLLSF
eukprot:1041478-Amphidinium_carterae.1